MRSTALVCAAVMVALVTASPAHAGDDTVPVPIGERAGWNVYTWQATDTDVHAAIARQRPALVRWFVETNRLLEDETEFGRPSRDWDWDTPTFRPFFRSLAANDVTLVVTIAHKHPGLSGGWARSLRACGTCNYPDIDAYGDFVAGLASVLGDHGVDVIWEAFNEPDLRSNLYSAGAHGHVENLTRPWQPVLDVDNGYAAYSGGTGRIWQEMHAAIPGAVAAGGITTRYVNERSLEDVLTGRGGAYRESTAWLDATAPLVDAVGLHRYGEANLADADTAFDWVYGEWSKWNAAAGHTLPFYLGEIGPAASGRTGIDDAFAADLRELHEKLRGDPRTSEHYLGMVAHVSAGAEHVDEIDTDVGWWETGETTNRSEASDPGAWGTWRLPWWLREIIEILPTLLAG